MITVGSLCTGIGLIDLGLEWAGLGPVLWQVEILPERRAVLEHWWPEVSRYDDVRTVTGLPYVDCIAFGSPCKNLSSAGDRSGLDGPQSRLFFDCLRVVEEVRPRWVVFENVASGGSLWVDRVIGELERLGYASLPVPLAASDCGAFQERGRVFIVAHLDQDREHARAQHAEMAQAPALAPDADLLLLRKQPGGERRPHRSDSEIPSWSGGRFAVPDMVRVVHGSADRLDGASQRVSALGDSCTPQQAEVIGHIVRILDNADHTT